MTNKPLIGAAIIGQSGGPSAVINASAYGVIKTALESEAITTVYVPTTASRACSTID